MFALRVGCPDTRRIGTTTTRPKCRKSFVSVARTFRNRTALGWEGIVFFVFRRLTNRRKRLVRPVFEHRRLGRVANNIPGRLPRYSRNVSRGTFHEQSARHRTGERRGTQCGEISVKFPGWGGAAKNCPGFRKFSRATLLREYNGGRAHPLSFASRANYNGLVDGK